MIWEARIKVVGDWVEAKIAVAQSGSDYSWVGQLMMHPNEWHDFAGRLGLQQGDNGVWRSS